MFEFHGWISVRTYHPISGPFDDSGNSMSTAMGAIRTRIASSNINDLASDWIEVRETTNGQIVVVAHGYRNHRRDYALRLFEWIAQQYRHSYGVLFVTDDEDVAKENEFTVHRFARGAMTEMSDNVLSPIVPTLFDAPAWDDSHGHADGK